MLSWNRSNTRLFNFALSGKVNPRSIDVNRKELSKRTEQIIQHMEDLMQLTYTTGAYVRKFMTVDKRDKFARLSPTENIKLTSIQINEERKKFVQESEDTMEKDKKRIQKFKN